MMQGYWIPLHIRRLHIYTLNYYKSYRERYYPKQWATAIIIQSAISEVYES